ncbi:hypothetical protein BDV38DRAFT_243175 [Aspergillus pseudotamarii]|uniref:Uncharacterized protein n=1 Tax=Aspergillus pseudotamarii TaxID=132259 RepID=A0A5N6SZV3_ASPPS|nr:uncharacterized protein BDV38DRAFT_243175 [Aspergillus pseudotamarii]KAE8139281.1 hypothetical protein BDV38DRAFT_243175 [Aspergillus pseudotamarii]
MKTRGIYGLLVSFHCINESFVIFLWQELASDAFNQALSTFPVKRQSVSRFGRSQRKCPIILSISRFRVVRMFVRLTNSMMAM